MRHPFVLNNDPLLVLIAGVSDVGLTLVAGDFYLLHLPVSVGVCLYFTFIGATRIHESK